MVISADLCEISPFYLHFRENALKPFRFSSDKPKGKNLTMLLRMDNVPMYVVLRVSCLYEYANVLEYFLRSMCMVVSFLYAPSRTCCYIGSSNSFGSTISSNTKTCFCCSFPSYSVPNTKTTSNTIAYSYIFRQFPVRPPSLLIDCTKWYFLTKNRVLHRNP